MGVPVYNAENYLEVALDSILAQTFTDFELIISDNASTDRTPEICRSYAGKDPRISYYRAEKNRGAAWNFNRVFELSSGKYFKWTAHDDLIAPDCLSKCVDVLEMDDSVVLCWSKVQYLNEHGDIIATYIEKLGNANSSNPRDRFGELTILYRRCIYAYGLIRSDELRKTSLIGTYPDADRVLLVELSLLGRYYEIPEYLFFIREHAEQFTKTYTEPYLRAGWLDPSKEGKISYWHWRTFFEYFIRIHRFSPELYDKACCIRHMVNWFLVYRYVLAGELLMFLFGIRGKEKIIDMWNFIMSPDKNIKTGK
jgi:glycosyltransferase involved in cell wall biosynthesis